MKKALSLFLSILFLLTALPLGAIPVAAATTTGTINIVGAELTYRITHEYESEVSITGCRQYFSGSLEIPSSIEGYPVTYISTRAFRYCNTLTSITIPNSVTGIGDYAFEGCSALSNVTIPNSVKYIDLGAFYNCDALTDITIPDSVTSIEQKVFYDCDALTNVTLSNRIATIDQSSFQHCDKLVSMTIPNSVTSIGHNAFRDCSSLCNLTIPNSVTSIGSSVFCGTALKSVVIPDSVTSMGYSAFEDCTSLTNVVIGDSLTVIDSYTFAGCSSLSDITLGQSVTTIGAYAFLRCTSLKEVPLPDSITTIHRCAFSTSGLTSITIPSGVTRIGDNAFTGCSNFTDVYYGGTEEDRADIVIDSNNEVLLNATWHYHEHSYDNVCDADCNDCGDIREPDHVYDNAYDTTCNECGAIREAEMLPVIFGGNSVSEDVSGLAFKFNVEASDMIADKINTAVYDNATLNGYKLLSMGAIVSNAVESIDIPAVYLFDWSDTDVTYAVRLINIPADQYDTVITATPYFVLEMDGVATTIYGEAQTASMNGVMNA